VLTVRIVKYKTKLTEEGLAVLEKESSKNYPNIDKKIASPESAYLIARDLLKMHEETEEYMQMLCMNNKNVVTGILQISHGNVNSAIVGTREVFQKALLANAVSIILMHNHPSGDPMPSNEDIKVTERLVEAGKLLGVNVLDHLVIGRGRYVSLKETGRMSG
jgi:DNA repair protein RadC